MGSEKDSERRPLTAAIGQSVRSRSQTGIHARNRCKRGKASTGGTDSTASIESIESFVLTVSRSAKYGVLASMGEWKASVTIRIRPSLRSELIEFAEKEHRSLGNLGAILLEWAFEQLKAGGSTERLLKFKLRPPGERSKQA